MKRRLQKLEKARANRSETLPQPSSADEASFELDADEEELEKSNYNVNDSQGDPDLDDLPLISDHSGLTSGLEAHEDKNNIEASTQSQNAIVFKTIKLKENDEGQDWLPTCQEDGDDAKLTEDAFTELQEAFSGEDPAILATQVNKDLCRRLTTIYDKSLSAGEFIY